MESSIAFPDRTGNLDKPDLFRQDEASFTIQTEQSSPTLHQTLPYNREITPTPSLFVWQNKGLMHEKTPHETKAPEISSGAVFFIPLPSCETEHLLRLRQNRYAESTKSHQRESQKNLSQHIPHLFSLDQVEYEENGYHDDTHYREHCDHLGKVSHNFVFTPRKPNREPKTSLRPAAWPPPRSHRAQRIRAS